MVYFLNSSSLLIWWMARLACSFYFLHYIPRTAVIVIVAGPEQGQDYHDRRSFPIRSQSWSILDHIFVILGIMIVSDCRSYILWVIGIWSAIPELCQNHKLLDKNWKNSKIIPQFLSFLENIFFSCMILLSRPENLRKSN